MRQKLNSLHTHAPIACSAGLPFLLFLFFLFLLPPPGDSRGEAASGEPAAGDFSSTGSGLLSTGSGLVSFAGGAGAGGAGGAGATLGAGGAGGFCLTGAGRSN